MIHTHKSLTISFLAVSIFILGLSADLVCAQTKNAGTAETPRPDDPLLSRYLRFGRLTTEDGLSSDQTYHVAQDSYGFMWFATADGLSRYDASSVKVYRHDPDDRSSLSHNTVRAMFLDKSDNLWLGTYGGGLNQYEREKDAFIRYQHDPDDPHSLSSNMVRSVYKDRNGTIWVGTAKGLNKLGRESRRFNHYRHDPANPNSLSHNLVWSILEDSAGVLWVGTEDGLNRFDPKTEQFIRYRHNPDDPASLSHNTVRAIYEDRSGILWLSTPRGLTKFNRDKTRFIRYLHDTADPQTLSNNPVTWVYEDRAGRLWVSTWGGGLNRFDRKTETFTHYRHDPADSYSLGADTVFQIYEDHQGMFWIASVGGISIIDGRAKPFQHYRSISRLPNTLSHNVVRALHAGRAGVVWVGTSGGGLNKFDRQTEVFTHYRHDSADPNSLSNDTVRAIYEDRMGLIWVGTSKRGLNRFDPNTERFTHFRHDPANHRSISKGSIMGINEDRTGTLWISTWGGGLNAFDRDSGQFTRYQHDTVDPQTLSNNQVICVFEDQAGVLWIGTMGGLNRFNRKTQTFTRYKHVATDPQSLVHDSVTCIHEDRTGTLWLGTIGGLDKFDRKNDQFTHFTTANGLPSELIWGILEDKQGRLWLSTGNGLSRLDPRTDSFRNYDVNDGLQSNTFLNFSAYSKSQDGEMFFGGSDGFNAFYPDQIMDNSQPPPVLITDFQLANKPVPIGADSVLQKSILETKNLVLSYRDRVFSFELAVLNYRAPQQNRYRYRMEGFEKDWNEVDRTRRFATYTNLDPGEYVFRAIGANNDGIWNEEGAAIKITIIPPWWETMWFRISMVVAAIGLFAGGFRWRIGAVEARNRELEDQVQRMTQIKRIRAERDRILEVSQDMICIAGTDGYFKYLNPAWEKNLGYTGEELQSEKFLNFVHPDDRDKTMWEFESLAAGNRTVDFENRYIHRDGSFRLFSWKATPLPEEKRVYAVGRDITERKQMEISLHASRKKAEALAAKLITSQEAGSARLARELHDDIIQRLAFLKIEVDKLGMIDPSLPEPEGDKLRHIARDIGVLSSDIHSISRRLHPISLEILGLVRSIETECQKFMELNEIPVTWDLNGTVKDPSKEISLCAYRILQEGLRNIVRHAKATGVHVTLAKKNDILHLLIKDNGIGFDPASEGVKAGLGIASMTERARLLQGSLSIESRPGKGTAIQLAVPLESR
ncbi:Periplasmic ligand-binding sensor domain COG3292 / BaeS-type histidine kinase / OmpR-type DNA-binding response regulator [Olavius algarvensis Delta 1 endosymbiont]|nr:Periplasmic ligand-binding sensor domain COG3292 / BaeS-type histidine kinase / OmpR-type DNA-binding response regulator [Olavius algarvensis Delta 1 endosymbiont]